MARKKGLRIKEVEQSVKGMPFPTTYSEIIEYAQRKGARDGVIDLLKKLPRREYKNMSEIINRVNIAKK